MIKNVKNWLLGGLMATTAITGGVAVKNYSDLNKVKQELNYYKEAEQNDRNVYFAIERYRCNQAMKKIDKIIRRNQGIKSILSNTAAETYNRGNTPNDSVK